MSVARRSVFHQEGYTTSSCGGKEGFRLPELDAKLEQLPPYHAPPFPTRRTQYDLELNQKWCPDCVRQDPTPTPSPATTSVRSRSPHHPHHRSISPRPIASVQATRHHYGPASPRRLKHGHY